MDFSSSFYQVTVPRAGTAWKARRSPAGGGNSAEGSYAVDVIITTQLLTISDEVRQGQEYLSAGGPNTAKQTLNLRALSRW